ncbi:hypothetical protein Syn7502_00817 [Synechococcus sp. PCC 7502]|uniref:hypothetical protein n=1 Tax=Synechococcus sp. PCC 7502 TaxID=1173263 RepID=UPI00029FAFB2|nr:hypothetical protein [Synechococcus sp. PCC 7502]AFY72949.1 hypothetical protein Syn7502_00817 [Synechococcus sp. PCC 7502]
MKKLFGLIPLAAVMMTMTTPKAAADAPGMSWTWREVRISHRQCLDRADSAIRDAGFNDSVETVGTSPDVSTFGVNDDYRAAIRCISDKGVVLFLVTGNGSDSGKLQRRLVNNFLR